MNKRSEDRKRAVSNIIDTLAFLAICAGIFAVCTYLTAPQNSAECEHERAMIGGGL